MPTSRLHNMLDQSIRLKFKQKILAINCNLGIQTSLNSTDLSKNEAKLGLNLPWKTVKIIKSIITLILSLVL